MMLVFSDTSVFTNPSIVMAASTFFHLIYVCLKSFYLASWGGKKALRFIKRSAGGKKIK